MQSGGSVRHQSGVEDRPTGPALDAYNSGRYAEAERAAEAVFQHASAAGIAAEERARARWVLAFAAARRGDLALSRERFARLQKEAESQPWTLLLPRGNESSLATTMERRREEEIEGRADGERPVGPGGEGLEDGERPVGPGGELLPTLEEEAAYQHAVLTAAPARKPRDAGSSTGTPGPAISTTAAEVEFLEFMRRYPESPLVHAAVKRIARLHGGDLPKEAEAVWRKAVAAARERREGRERDRSLCGPEVLAEILERVRATGGTMIHTASSERLNATFRSRLAGLVRRTRSLLRRERMLQAGMYLVGGVYNFCTPHRSVRRELPAGGGRKWEAQTPAVAPPLRGTRAPGRTDGSRPECRGCPGTRVPRRGVGWGVAALPGGSPTDRQVPMEGKASSRRSSQAHASSLDGSRGHHGLMGRYPGLIPA